MVFLGFQPISLHMSNTPNTMLSRLRHCCIIDHSCTAPQATTGAKNERLGSGDRTDRSGSRRDRGSGRGRSLVGPVADS